MKVYSQQHGISVTILCDDFVYKFKKNHSKKACIILIKINSKLEDLKTLRRSPDLLNNVKIGQGQLQLIMKHILFHHIWGCSHLVK